MDHEGSDDAYDDADFEGLPPNTYQELEYRARQSTQQGEPIARLDRLNNNTVPHNVQDDESADLDDRGPPSSDYGLDDEDVIDLDKPEEQQTVTARHTQYAPRIRDEVTEREHWRQQRYGAGTVPLALRSPVASRPPAPSQGQTNALTGKASGIANKNGQRLPPAPSDLSSDVGALQARVAELEKAHALAIKENEDAKAAAYAKAGEIAIVRANQDRVAKEYENKMAALQRLQTEELARYRSELDVLRKQREKLETNSKFLEHDLAQETERARKKKQGQVETRGSAGKRISRPSPLSTPQKNRNLPFRDGFDDGEVVAAVSPSKAKGKARVTTPKAGGKRKRNPAQPDSPIAPLSFTESEAAVDYETDPPPQPEFSSIRLPLRSQVDTAGELIEFTQVIMDHGTRGNKRTIEILTDRAFPSSPSTTLASQLYDAMRLSSPMPSIEEFRIRVCNRLLDLWSRCLEEKHYVSVAQITDLLEFILTTGPVSLGVALIPRAVPLCIATADLIAVPRAKASKAPSVPLDVDPDIEAHINPFDCLELLHLLALFCRQEGENHITEFSSLIEHDFILLMLAKAQPLSQITLMLRILSATVLDTSFGAIASPARSSTSDPAGLSARQTKTQYEIISRLTVLLFDIPIPPLKPLSASSQTTRTSMKNPPPQNPALAREPNLTPSKQHYTPHSLLHLRHSVLVLLDSITQTPTGLSAFCAHRLALGRLVRFLHEQVLELYRFQRSTHATTSALVNAATLLLAHVEVAGGEKGELDLRARLGAEPGGSYKHLVALGRVGFAEGGGAEQDWIKRRGGIGDYDGNGHDNDRQSGENADPSEDNDEDEAIDIFGEQEENADDLGWTSGMESGISVAASEAALRLLDECLSPEEGEAVVSCFSSGR